MVTKTLLRRVTTIILGLTSLLIPTLSLAHPLGNFSISHYTNIRLEPHHIALLYLLDLAEIPTFQEIQEMGFVPETGHASVPAYLAKRVETLQKGVLLEVNGKRLALQPMSSEVLFPPGAGGLPTLKIGIEYRAALDAVSEERYRLAYRDTNFSGRTGWHEIIVSAGADVTVEHSSVPTTDRSRALTDYPTDLLNSPPQVLEAQVVFSRSQALQSATAYPPSQGTGTTDTTAALAANTQGTPRHSFTELITTQQLSFGMLCLALLVAAGLGALHALEPGHGKTVVAAYLVGSRGTARHALYLGLIVTLTHTAGVYVLGLITLYASQYVLPERLYPWLGILSGLVIAGLGCYLFLQRYANIVRAHSHAHNHRHRHDHGHDHDHLYAHAQAQAQAHDEAHRHPHEHAHSHAPHHHEMEHRDHPHTHHSHSQHDDQQPHGHSQHHGDHHHGQHHHHALPDGTVSFRQLLALGITGGIVPCPAALVVLLSAVSLHRIGFGLLLIVAFSAGLAMVLIAIGILMVYAQRFMTRFQGQGPLLTRWLPLTSAALITIFGVAMVVQAMGSAGML